MRADSLALRLVLAVSGLVIAVGFSEAAFASDGAADVGKPTCTFQVPIDIQEHAGDTGKTNVLPDRQTTPQDRICFAYTTTIPASAGRFIYNIVENGPEAPLLSWSDVTQVVSVLSPSTKAPGAGTANKAQFAYAPKTTPIGDPSGYSLQVGNSITATVIDNVENETWQVTVKVPYPSVPWKMFIGATATSGRWDSAYSLQATTPSGESRIQDVSRNQWDPSRVYGSLFWIRDYNNIFFNPAVGFGLNGGHPSAFAGFGTVFGGVGLIYGLALAPTDVLTPQYQHVYDTRGKVPSKTSVGSLTTKSYRPTIFVGLGVTFCITSCPTKAPAQATNPNPNNADNKNPNK